MTPSVLDSYAVLALLFAERCHEQVVDLFEQAARADTTLAITAPNWAEVRYVSQRKAGTRRWAQARERLLALPLDVVPADRELAERAGEIKAVKRMSLADCFAAALAREREAELYTGDPEFREVEREVRIVWL